MIELRSVIKQFIKVLRQQYLRKLLLWIFALASYGYLIYILLYHQNYNELFFQFKQISWQQYPWLLLVFGLLPANILTESIKWKQLISGTEKLSIGQSLKSVLAGFSSGFFTPNRSGEFAGRILFLKDGHRKAGIVYSFINSLTQNFVMALVGIPATVLLFSVKANNTQVLLPKYLICVGFLAVLMIVFYFSFPAIARNKKLNNRFSFLQDIGTYNISKLLQILAISLFRYLIFTTQMFAMLLFWGIDINLWQAALAIPTTYLFVTFTPSLAFAEAAVRGSYAAIFIGIFAHQPAAVAFAGMCLWAVNSGIPVIVGNAIVGLKRI
ncbi:MAG: lysylphosphatidylglycerol synthase domain-containing protein [Paludibacter sp.]|nr:lysylphosphatidylglycerol synthase domain-containing protein [Paludibacter sp.]